MLDVVRSQQLVGQVPPSMTSSKRRRPNVLLASRSFIEFISRTCGGPYGLEDL